jgi:hypothetical protein
VAFAVPAKGEMMNRLVLIAVLVLAGCGARTNDVSNQPGAQAKPATPQPAPPPAPEAEKNVPAPAARPAHEASLPEPRGPIDPKSVEAAGQVVQHFGALVESNRYVEASKLWGDADAAGKFTKGLRPGTHLEIGELGPAEGAAGSIYTTVPVTFYGSGYRKPADVILRRVNDVPGSTEAQRRWHIERIEWK